MRGPRHGGGMVDAVEADAEEGRAAGSPVGRLGQQHHELAPYQDLMRRGVRFRIVSD